MLLTQTQAWPRVMAGAMVVATPTPGAALIAVLVDLVFGEPPSSVHPTVWIGRLLNALKKTYSQRIERGSNSILLKFSVGSLALASAALFALAIAGVLGIALGWVLFLAACAGYVQVERYLRGIGGGVGSGIALKPSLSVKALLRAAEEVAAALEKDDLPTARRLLAWHLVSRQTNNLERHEIAGAVISSLAENLCDSIVAPLMAYRVGGLPAAYVYRAVNTADAMFGYRTPAMEWFGKPAARADDLLNLVPARISALLIALLSPLAFGSPIRAVRSAFRCARYTSSPNGGWPMSAMAGALNVRLEKAGHYVLNENGADSDYQDIRRAARVILASAISAALLVELSLVGRALRSGSEITWWGTHSA